MDSPHGLEAGTAEVSSSVIYCKSENEYHTALEKAGDKLVVVDCFASWCPPCQQIAPIFERLSKDENYSHIVFIKVDMDQVPKLKSELGVYALPTFCFLQQGSKVGSFMGANVRMLKYGLQNGGKVSMCSSAMCTIQ